MNECTNYIESWAPPAIDRWFREQCADPSIAFYLYYKPKKGGISISETPLNDGWQLASGERVSNAITKEQCKYWVKDTLRSLPCL